MTMLDKATTSSVIMEKSAFNIGGSTIEITGRKLLWEKAMNHFKAHPIFGTGFDNMWRNKIGDEIGFEATDYPFQAALAMTGIIGCL